MLFMRLVGLCAGLLLYLPTTGFSGLNTVSDPSQQNVRITDRLGRHIGLYTASYALVIGVSKYRAGWRELPGVDEDITAVETALKTHGFEVQVVRDPTGEALRRAFAHFIRRYGHAKEARLLIYFAGHGHTLRMSYGDQMGYIVPVDAPTPSQDAVGFQATAMDMQQIEVYAKRIQAKHVLFMFDSCFSGSIFDTVRSGGAPGYISEKTNRPVRQFITSGDADEEVPDVSLFRQELVTGLSGDADADQDGYITGTELGEYLHKQVVTYSNRTQTPQHGKIRNRNLNKGDFVFWLPRPSVADRAPPRLRQAAVRAQSLSLPDVLTDAIGMVFKLIPAGRFRMGAPDGAPDERPVHQVFIRQPFYLGVYEVTQAQWQTGMGTNPSQFQGFETHPVERVTWDDVQVFIAKLNAIEGKEIYRLPTEAEWEYAARTAGVQDGDDRGKATPDNAWCDANSDRTTHPVGQGQPNAWGLYDMRGNVWEWVQDWYGPYPAEIAVEPQGPVGGMYRVLRGGSWFTPAVKCRAQARSRWPADDRDADIGLRLVRQVE